MTPYTVPNFLKKQIWCMGVTEIVNSLIAQFSNVNEILYCVKNVSVHNYRENFITQ